MFYTHQVNFEKVYISGVLQGQRIPDFVRCINLEEAEVFSSLDGTIRTSKHGGGNYKQVCSTIEVLND